MNFLIRRKVHPAERQNTPRGRVIKAHSKELQVHRQSEPEQNNGEVAGLREQLKGWLAPKTFSYMCVTFTCLIIGVIKFCQTKDTTMLQALIPYAAATAASDRLPEIKSLILRGTKGGHDQQRPTSE